MPIQDKYERVIDYLRISITDRCNLRCIYCMPSEGVKLIRHKDILRYEEIIRIVQIAADLGVRKVRLTGGEPLTRKDLPPLVAAISAIEGIEDISLTTNGLLLERLARPLAEAGLKRVNVSLDSLRPERYREITRGGDIRDVLAGIEEAEKAGILPIKLNMVPIRGFNDDEIEDFARLTLRKDYDVRFIEFMPIGAREIWSHEKYISTEEIRKRVEAIAPLLALKLRKAGPARYFRFGDAPGVIGFISPITHHFCGSCNRLRITSDGKLRPCLFSETEIDLKPALRGDTPDSEVEKLL
ncbi:MAG: GTP 3',8-cyclase MoaA, partial [Nitrospirales bacterium]|nr:GTP 3',8-cyclase MoaA [Nitrospirales bacterium]